MITNTIIQRFIEKHGNKYDYSKVEYINAITKVIIICPEHGEFLQTPHAHLKGQGCPQCAKISRIKQKTSNTNNFIEKAKKIHGDKYDYSKVKYKLQNEKVTIICPEHGEFLQTPHNHLSGYGCPECKKASLKNLRERYTSLH